MDTVKTAAKAENLIYGNKEKILENLHRFLGVDEDDINGGSLEERTKSAIVLLQCLPCARSAIFEQIGEVFHEVAKKYVIEVEKQMLSGQPGFAEVDMPELDVLVKNIQSILVGFVTYNCDVWAPQIARWSISLVGELCSQYGVLRAFSTMPIDERMQLWMNCQACRLLMDISVTCFAKIIEDKPEICVEYLLETAAESSPFFDWAVAHICCCFLDVVPYGILSHALQAFSMQAKHAETVINCVTRVYNYLLNQHGRVLQNAVLDLFKDSVAGLTVEAGSEQEHIDKCTLPFLLHLALQVPQLVDQISEKVIDLLDLKTLSALNEQASKREIVLQRGLLARVLDILKYVGCGTFKILMFLVNNSCNTTFFSDGDVKLLDERKRICGTLLEMLLLSLHESVQNQIHARTSDTALSIPQLNEEIRTDSPFLKELQKHSTQICQELLKSSGCRANILVRVLSIISFHGSREAATEILGFLFMNSKSSTNLIHVFALQHELEVCFPNILEHYVNCLVGKMCEHRNRLHNLKVFSGLNNCMDAIQETGIQKEQSRRIEFSLQLEKKWTAFTDLSCIENQDVSFKSLQLLDILTLPSQQPLSDVFKASRNLVATYFNCLRRIFNNSEIQDTSWEIVKLCEKLLILLVKEYSVVQHTVLRMILETILGKENNYLVIGKKPTNAVYDDDEVLIKEAKILLLERNQQPDIVSRIPVNRSSVIYAGSLNRNKRKVKETDDSQLSLKSGLIRQFLLNTLEEILTFKLTPVDKMDVNKPLESSFSDAHLQRVAESEGKSSYGYLATLLAEMVCSDVVATLPWPDEEFLKYTVERDIRIKKQFDLNPFLWEILSLICRERPALYNCIIIIQSLLASCLTYWEVDRKKTVDASPNQIWTTCKTLEIIKEAGWLPEPWCNTAEILRLLKPNEVYKLLSGIWRFCKDLNISPMRFVEKDYLGRPSIAFPEAQVATLRQLFRDIFLQNIALLGLHFKRFFQPSAIS